MISVANPRKFSALALAVIVIMGIALFRLVWGSGVILKSGDIEIVQGQKPTEIWRMLVRDGYSDRTIPWRYYGHADNAATKIQAGTYHIEKSEKVSGVLERFMRGDVQSDELDVTIPEGFTLKQIGARFEQRGVVSAKDFIAEARAEKYASQFSFLTGLSAGRNLEGYLFPDTYRVKEGDTAHDIIVRMLGNFDRKVPEEFRKEAEAQGRTLDEEIIVASMIEKEVRDTKDMNKVSDILWKRLDDGTGLYVDATLEYIVDKNGALTVADLNKDTPYNTRKYKGLPPSPISNPGLSAIMAALRPEKNDAYYYLTDKDGNAIFAKTNDEHNRNKVKYLR